MVSIQNGLNNWETIARQVGEERTVGARVIFGAEIQTGPRQGYRQRRRCLAGRALSACEPAALADTAEGSLPLRYSLQNREQG